jgi:hypothetical protein
VAHHRATAPPKQSNKSSSRILAKTIAYDLGVPAARLRYWLRLRHGLRWSWRFSEAEARKIVAEYTAYRNGRGDDA